jgi:hypothetical protein
MYITLKSIEKGKVGKFDSNEIEMVVPLRVMAAALTNRSDVHRVFEFIGTVGEKAVAIVVLVK